MPDLLVSQSSLGRVVVTGELDIATAPQIDTALAGRLGDVIVDCRDLTFIDSAGFHAFDRGYDAAMQRSATFVVCGLNEFQTRIAKIFELPYVLSSSDREGSPTRSAA